MSVVTHLIYRLYDEDDRLLYIGVTQDWTKRRQHHAIVQPWFPLVQRVELESCGTRQDAIAREADLIRTLAPRYNAQHKPLPPPSPLASTPDMDELLTVEQAAHELAMHAGAVRKAILAKRITAQRIGARVLVITRAEVERYKRERQPRGRPPAKPPTTTHG